MKNFLIFTVCLGFSLPAFAEWNSVGEWSYRAATKNQVYNFFQNERIIDSTDFLLKEKQKRDISGYNDGFISSTFLTITTLKWMGPNSCTSDDARQFREIRTGQVYYTSGITFSWQNGYADVPSDWDPCLEDNTKEKSATIKSSTIKPKFSGKYVQ